ncbi:MAG: hypothetical protein QGH66_04065 [Dehalococcoidia bacterium]|jgi:hypothetical protein|nr:hypothetical protein [Dehalococcoidia bacterium]
MNQIKHWIPFQCIPGLGSVRLSMLARQVGPMSYVVAREAREDYNVGVR